MPSLGEYRRKRDPARTPKPFAGGGGGGAPIFVVQRHAARRLHYDLRLERAGVLASWALPKGLPLETGAKHLAIHVETTRSTKRTSRARSRPASTAPARSRSGTVAPTSWSRRSATVA